MNKNITDFFINRKTAWLDKKKDATADEFSKLQLQTEANEKFSLVVWLPDAAKRASQLFMASHPSKFSHPDAKTSAIIATNTMRTDGYLRTGNVKYELDVFGNAAAMDVYKFLSLKMNDGQTILTHLEAETDAIKTALNIPTMSFDDLKKGFLAIKTSNENTTDGLVKQVYFPISETSKLNNKPQNYHLLSVLTPSGLLTRIKQNIDDIRFGEITKQAREARKKNEFSDTGYDDIPNLTVTAYGGTKPQNISALNSQNGGVAYLLPCIPPKLVKRNIQLPTQDFFENSLRLAQFKDDFFELHGLIKLDKNNIDINQKITNVLNIIIGRILECAIQIRTNNEAGWSEQDHYQHLPLYQSIWLDNFHNQDRIAIDEWATGIGKRQSNYQPLREDEDLWLDKIITDCARWIITSYEKTIKTVSKKDPITLSDYELNEIKHRVADAIAAEKEFFK